MNWLLALTNALKILPYVVAGIETIHTNESTETKTQLAQDALGITVAGAGQVLSGPNAQIALAVGQSVNASIVAAQSAIAAIKGNSAPTS